MKGLTLGQPFATLVALGAKKVETRSWGTPYRGLVAIHAARGFPPEWRSASVGLSSFVQVLAPAGYVHPDNLPLGSIVAVARLADCRRMTNENTKSWALSEQEILFGNYEPGRWAWFLEDVRALPSPVPVRGMLGLWPVPEYLAIDLEVRRDE